MGGGALGASIETDGSAGRAAGSDAAEAAADLEPVQAEAACDGTACGSPDGHSGGGLPWRRPQLLEQVEALLARPAGAAACWGAHGEQQAGSSNGDGRRDAMHDCAGELAGSGGHALEGLRAALPPPSFDAGL